MYAECNCFILYTFPLYSPLGSLLSFLCLSDCLLCGDGIPLGLLKAVLVLSNMLFIWMVKKRPEEVEDMRGDRDCLFGCEAGCGREGGGGL